MKKIKLSKNLSHTWFIDIDGTILKHNGYITDKKDTLLKGVIHFFNKIPKKDKIILTTSRKSANINELKKFLKKNKIRFNRIISDLPYGERILINDIKPKKKLKTAIAINVVRDQGF
jgi:hypothetical protein